MFTDLFKKISFSFIGDDKMSSSVRKDVYKRQIVHQSGNWKPSPCFKIKFHFQQAHEIITVGKNGWYKKYFRRIHGVYGGGSYDKGDCRISIRQIVVYGIG